MCLDTINPKIRNRFKFDKKGRVIAFQRIIKRNDGYTPCYCDQYDKRVFLKGKRYAAKQKDVMYFNIDVYYKSGFHGVSSIDTYRLPDDVWVEVRLSGKLTFGQDSGRVVCVGEYRTIIGEVKC